MPNGVNGVKNGTSRRIRRVLVANRGEIAVRVMRTCRELDIETVAVYSDSDRTALHVRMAHHAVHLGPAPARESYLDVDKIIDACRRSGADALHPGYGFLSENDALPEACARAGLVFIGPPADVMRQMGDKTSARAAVARVGVPVVPGESGSAGRGFESGEVALAAARRIGFPVMLKAAAGGGGKGMRLVDSETKLAAAYDSARREAKAAFGDDSVYLEKAIVAPRHVEIQIFADESGQAVHLGERDCSIQRRHQKVVEESPSPALSRHPEGSHGHALRERMGEMALRVAKACGYRGAGTVECLLAPDGSFYFLEMNTRLQVEHPVTEMLYGVDLVAWQIAVAEGRPLPLTQEQVDLRRRGAALECRIYAEDPVRFLPSPGRISGLRVPSGPCVRDDSGVTVGSEISVHYDPLVAKLIVWGEDRAQALRRMRRALDEYRVAGIKTNLPFHRNLMSHPAFIQGDYDTGFIEREKATLCTQEALGSQEAELALIAAAIHVAANGDRSGSTVHPPPAAAFQSLSPSAWRLATGPWRR